MMMNPNCPEHERLVLDLALGRLDDDDAARAEDVKDSCPVCREWWSTQFEGEAIDLVDDAIASVFEDVDLPRRRRSHGWMALAAAVVMSLGATALWMVQRPVAPAPNAIEPVIVERIAAIQSMDFENPSTVVAHTIESEPETREPAVGEPSTDRISEVAPVADEIVVAEAAPAELPRAPEPEPLFSGSFESGDLSGWVPST
jgi:hypothetical protein